MKLEIKTCNDPVVIYQEVENLKVLRDKEEVTFKFDKVTYHVDQKIFEVFDPDPGNFRIWPKGCFLDVDTEKYINKILLMHKNFPRCWNNEHIKDFLTNIFIDQHEHSESTMEIISRCEFHLGEVERSCEDISEYYLFMLVPNSFKQKQVSQVKFSINNKILEYYKTTG